jgi:hypothetical protein
MDWNGQFHEMISSFFDEKNIVYLHDSQEHVRLCTTDIQKIKQHM